jgi:UPF0755 protein
MLASQMDDDRPPPRVERHADRRPRRVALLVTVVLFLGLVGAAGALASYYVDCREAPEPREGTVAFEVAEGASGERVLADLHRQGLVACDGFVGQLLLRGTGRADEIRAGTYELRVGMTLDEILGVLTAPPPKIPTVELTIVEGLRIDTPVKGRDDIASEVEEQLGLSAERFLRLVGSGRFGLPPYVERGRSLEGFLFPKTYEFVEDGLTERKVLEAMLEQFRVEAERLDLVGGAERLDLTPYEVVVLASMIEKEYGVEADGPLISGVIHNRLRLGMTLGIDATLLYDDPTPDGELSTADIETDTPYNTRINGGLTPTPIASPGAAALGWALHPAETDYLYYVLCGHDGAHRFAETYEEHLRNVDACLG